MSSEVRGARAGDRSSGTGEGAGTGTPPRHRRVGAVLRRWTRHAQLSPGDRDSAMEALMVRPSWASLRRYAVLLLLSVVVASLGLLEDSTAVVVGAMMIAPLMAPIMGLAASVVMGWGERLLRGAAVVGLSVAAAVGMAWIIAGFLPAAGATLPTEVLSRSSPDVRDLGVALAAGAAGAYATVRRNISGALPGVAVAVALVPPLATIGVLLGRGQPDLAGGAGLLFVTNLFAIVLAAAVVFLISGFVPAHRFRSDGHRLAVVLAVTAVPTIVVGVLLTGRFVQTAERARELRLATQAVVTWLGSSGDDLNAVKLSGSTVQVNIAGPAAPPPLQTLTDSLTSALGRQTTVDLRWTPVRDGTPEPTRPALALDAVRPVVEEWLAGQSLTLDGLSYTGAELVVRISGQEPPRSSEELTALIGDRLGVQPPVSLTWTRTSPSPTATPGDRTAADTVRAVLQEWAATQDGITVLGVQDTGSAIVATLTGTTRPDTTLVHDQLSLAAPQRGVVIQWIPGALLASISPTPTAPGGSVTPSTPPAGGPTPTTPATGPTTAPP